MKSKRRKLMSKLTLRTLIKRVQLDEELPDSEAWVNKMIREGKLLLPKKAYAKKGYQLTEEVIEEAIEGLKTKGYYHGKDKG